MANESAEISIGPPLGETVLPPVPSDWAEALAAAASDVEAVRAVVRSYPRFIAAWARLGQLSDDDVAAYAYFRTGYHRGLDALRQAGWRGSGYVRYSAPGNRGFLQALDGLATMAGRIGEEDEETRCRQFLRQLDPGLSPGSLPPA